MCWEDLAFIKPCTVTQGASSITTTYCAQTHNLFLCITVTEVPGVREGSCGVHYAWQHMKCGLDSYKSSAVDNSPILPWELCLSWSLPDVLWLCQYLALGLGRDLQAWWLDQEWCLFTCVLHLWLNFGFLPLQAEIHQIAVSQSMFRACTKKINR